MTLLISQKSINAGETKNVKSFHLVRLFWNCFKLKADGKMDQSIITPTRILPLTQCRNSLSGKLKNCWTLCHPHLGKDRPLKKSLSRNQRKKLHNLQSQLFQQSQANKIKAHRLKSKLRQLRTIQSILTTTAKREFPLQRSEIKRLNQKLRFLLKKLR